MARGKVWLSGLDPSSCHLCYTSSYASDFWFICGHIASSLTSLQAFYLTSVFRFQLKKMFHCSKTVSHCVWGWGVMTGPAVIMCSGVIWRCSLLWMTVGNYQMHSSVRPQWRSLEWSTRCVRSLIHLCKPAITGIIGLRTCAAHRGLRSPQSCGGQIVWDRCQVCLFRSRGCRWVMDVSIYCTLQISQPFIHPSTKA